MLSLTPESSIGVVTLATAGLVERLAELKPNGLSIVGKLETENIGIEKIIQNTLAAANIKVLILCGKDSEGHFAGQTLEALVNNGVDDAMRVVGSKGRKAVLANASREEIEAFRTQVTVINRIGLQDEAEILREIEAQSECTRSQEQGIQGMRIWGQGLPDTFKVTLPMVGSDQLSTASPPQTPNTFVTITAAVKDPNQVKLDKEGYFVIVPKADSGRILVEHYSNQNQLLHIIQGDNARDLYWTILERGMVSELSHAAYLGKELMAAELSLTYGFKYLQDKA
ncbi:tetrahydromethanopterin S-methyltransferase subunit A [Acidaminobacter hydrogenoformans DSM 2784]|uniref:Tetrahydromethanopterin S-methyltransferase subunit A n=1 Tax=Acidaminobacter hydrogenoformans DSM 2784 TaxID=1120920 RepID=A0A1G5S0A0_9FIRM|nr:tetrahydromethanopterin S-methyltransferase subunit A [Acidaminobacter hydrogenoformans DSM 2784]